jgi:hypothetical protein
MAASRHDRAYRPAGEPWPYTRAWWGWTGRWMRAEFVASVRSSSTRGTPAVTTSAMTPTKPDAQTEPHPPAIRSSTAIWVLTMVGLAPAVLGFALDLSDFEAHALAGVSGLILGAVLAVVLIDELLRRRRREHWALVYAEMRRSIAEAVLEMGTRFAAMLPGRSAFLDLAGPEDDPLPRADIADSLQRLLDDLRRGATSLAADIEQPDRSSTRRLYDQVAPIAAPLRTATTTRVIALGDQPLLVSALLTFERAERLWQSWLLAVEHEGAPDRFAWEHAVATLSAATGVYRLFV